ncbi:sulfotransferase [Thioalkalivibrio sp. ALJ1]|uniref:tetratricopeptide repeat-containing sulfotransferase family protein n=1 Tax=Thioalkalivibrio sp. ALJ1 TaxID=1158144 RepID=UPI001FCAF4C3|nr:sulfotransferase [Thioalkalivibrio sp. ALJ1]
MAAGKAGGKRKAKPSKVAGLLKKAKKALDDGAFEELEALCGQVLGIEPNSTDALRLLIQGAFDRHQYSTATLYASKLVQMCPKDADSYNALAGVLILRDRFEAAGAALREALRLDPNMRLALDNYARVLQAEGRWDEATEILESLVESDRNSAKLWFSFAHSRHFPADGSPRKELEKIIRKGKFDLRDQGRLYFALAKLHQDAGDLDQAFSAFELGNSRQAEAIHRQVEQVRQGAIRKNVAATEKIFCADWARGLDDPNQSPRPLTLVLGPPRSGKSLLEGPLSGHTRVRHYGELAVLQEVLSQLPKEVRKRYPLIMRELEPAGIAQMRARVDSMWGEAKDESVRTHLVTNPGNVFHVGTFMSLYPGTRVVFCERDPVDNAMAIYMRWFAQRLPYAWAIDTIAEFLMLYRRMADHWERIFPDRVQRVHYEEMLENPDAHVARVLAAHDLEWEAVCADDQGEIADPALLGLTGSLGRRSRVNPAFASIGEQYEAYRPAFEEAVGAARAKVFPSGD